MKPDPVAVLDKVFELADRVGDLMQASLTERGLTTARAEVLLVLRHHDGPLVQRQLSEILRCTPRHVTALVDALEDGGWVTRGPHPTDRRATLVALTAQGVAAAHRMDTERHTAAHQLFYDLADTEIDGFLAVAEHVLSRMGASPTPPGTSTRAAQESDRLPRVEGRIG